MRSLAAMASVRTASLFEPWNRSWDAAMDALDAAFRISALSGHETERRRRRLIAEREAVGVELRALALIRSGTAGVIAAPGRTIGLSQSPPRASSGLRGSQRGRRRRPRASAGRAP